jgi:hypothetical protein
MKNSTFTIAFLNSTDLNVKNEILSNIANHYGITNEQAYEEVIDEEAESLIDYVNGNIRSAISVLIQKFKLTYDANKR